jgi:hypothetical protein
VGLHPFRREINPGVGGEKNAKPNKTNYSAGHFGSDFRPKNRTHFHESLF